MSKYRPTTKAQRDAFKKKNRKRKKAFKLAKTFTKRRRGIDPIQERDNDDNGGPPLRQHPAQIQEKKKR